MTEFRTQLAGILKRNEERIVRNWVSEQNLLDSSRISTNELKEQCELFLRHLTEALQTGDFEHLQHPSWEHVRRMLSEVSRSRGLLGFSPSETATFIFSLKRPVFSVLREELVSRPQDFAAEVWAATTVVDQLGLFSMETYQKTREEVILRQQEEMLELSTPVVKLWQGILALPMIGTLDSSRTQSVMESLLQKIVETGSEVAIIDITGVPTVDTLVAQHLIKTVTAARLMGADCIISGIRPQIAATIVHLGVDLGGISTKATLADAFLLALQKTGRMVGRNAAVLREGRA